MNFASDNTAGVAPEIMHALAEANQGRASAYGADAWTDRAERALADAFECEVAAFPLATGTAANALALSALTPPWGQVYCHRHAHIEEDECGAPELFSGGAKLALLDGADARFTAGTLAEALAASHPGVEHHMQPAAVSITQASERGTCYRADEVRAIAEVTHAAGLKLHMDGARFANALAFLGCSPAELTWKAGVDVLSFGATKNGAMAAEAVVFFDPALASDFRFRRKRAGQLLSKMRFVSAQLVAYLDNDLWLANARHANAAALRLSAALAGLPGAALCHPVEANEIFITLPESVIAGLEAAGVGLARWHGPGTTLVRLVTAFDTPAGDVDRLIALATALAEKPRD